MGNLWRTAGGNGAGADGAAKAGGAGEARRGRAWGRLGAWLRLGVLVAVPALGAQEARLSNLAIRAQAGAGADLITGFTIGAGGTKTVLVRAVGPTLGQFGIGDALADPKLELFSGERKIAENDNWAAGDAAAFATVGAFALAAGSKDAALVTTLPGGSYTVQVSGLGAGGVALVEVYELSGGGARLVNLSTRAQVGAGGNILIPGITISAGQGERRLLVRAVGPTLGAFGVGGTLADPKLELFAGSTKIAENDDWGAPVGARAADAATVAAASAGAGAFALAAGGKDAALLVNLGAGSYTLQVSGVAGATGAALVEVYDLTPENRTGARPSASLYVAHLRPEAGATGSTASGYATITINPDGTATVGVTFSNLSSAQTSAHLQLGAGRDYVLNLPAGQVGGARWTFAPSGAYTTNDLVEALNNGNIAVGIDSARFPGGELRGNFIRGTGSQTFAAPAAPSALPAAALAAPSPAEAARFLTQATFGPTSAEIAALTESGIPRWLDAQLALPFTSHFAGLQADAEAFPNPPVPESEIYWRYLHQNRVAAWWKIVLTAPDQLRQRVAFALSEIFVVSDRESTLAVQQESITNYYDLLGRHAFGNFRQLIDDVSRHAAMGWWLTFLRNQKANPERGTSPDENYARELMQLFTIGLVQLQPDGTLLLDSAGRPIPTYDQTKITETAKVFTGWAFANVQGNFFSDPPWNRFGPLEADNGWLNPLICYETYHDKTQKNVVSLQQVPLDQARPTAIPANQTGPQDLKALLDTLFNHPNTGPFFSRQLIQRLVTSNPSPGYVHRVARVFADDGTGTRGNLAAVVRAVLADYEARSPDVRRNAGYGKIKEPLLRASAFMRVFKAAAPNGRYMDSYFGEAPVGVGGSATFPRGNFVYPDASFNQAPMRAPTVFGFFSPAYSPPGPLAAAGLVAPELEITDGQFSITTPNWFTHSYLYRTGPPATTSPTPSPSPYLEFDYSEFVALAGDPAALVDRLDLLFCAGQMSAATRAQILGFLQRLPANTAALTRVKNAIELTIFSPDSALQL